MNLSDAELIADIQFQLINIPDEKLRESINEALTRFEYSSEMFLALKKSLRQAVED